MSQDFRELFEGWGKNFGEWVLGMPISLALAIIALTTIIFFGAVEYFCGYLTMKDYRKLRT